MKSSLLILLSLLAACSTVGTESPPAPDAFVPSQPTVLITGANRGLGLEFARQYAALGWNVIASCRDPGQAMALQKLAAEFPHFIVDRLDVTSDADVQAIAAKYADQPIDVLLNNAGIYGELDEQSLGNFNFEELKRVLDVNSIGSLRMAEAFTPHVQRSQQKKIISLGGGMGTPGIGRLVRGHYFFKMSKAAHLSAVVSLQADLKDSGVLVTMISPGRVDTRMLEDSGWTGKSVSAAESASLVITMIEEIKPEMGGRLITYNGMVLPWR
ncbi:MAG: SDR family oxidoreductase [Gammaproteobacteria bacterium]